MLPVEVFDYDFTGMAAVANPSTDRNWAGHQFLQSSWYTYGRLAWGHTLGAGSLPRSGYA